MPKITPFEQYSSQYEAWFEKNRFAYKSEICAIKKVLPKNKHGVEIGIGSGKFAVPLGIKIGVDPCAKMRKIAEKRDLKVIEGVAEKLPFENSTFDFALMVTTICFLDNIEKSFQEAYQILKWGGCLIIGFVDKNSAVGKMYLQHKHESIFYKDAKFYSVDEVVFYLKESGFKDFIFYQTIFKNLKDIKKIEPVKRGYGKGSFVVIKVKK
ncbi:MAG: class I SAM-dependent methyltransferase [Acidobacteriota bacterium]|nr:class I SAM-dependent methyltransferase [Acidobacteriota bacterium]